MIDRPADATWIGILIIMAAVTGAIGGVGGAAHIFLSRNRPVRHMQLVAYSILGMMMSVLAFGVISFVDQLWGLEIQWPIEAFIAFCLAFGFGGSLILSGVNVAVRWATKHFGDWEVKFTARQDSSDRRNKKGGHDERRSD